MIDPEDIPVIKSFMDLGLRALGSQLCYDTLPSKDKFIRAVEDAYRVAAKFEKPTDPPDDSVEEATL